MSKTDNFENTLFSEYKINLNSGSNIIKAGKTKLNGRTKVSIEEEEHDNVKIILKKDADDSIKEIKFVCSCGNTKSLILDYSD